MTLTEWRSVWVNVRKSWAQLSVLFLYFTAKIWGHWCRKHKKLNISSQMSALYSTWCTRFDPRCSFWLISSKLLQILTKCKSYDFRWHGCFLPPAGFSHLDVMLVECYDPKADQWNILQTPILEGRSGPGCAVLDDSIFLVGGYSWSMVQYMFTDKTMLCWSVSTNHRFWWLSNIQDLREAGLDTLMLDQ